jgi:16S rRNA (cytosine1402-N4)-methyltransferase
MVDCTLGMGGHTEAVLTQIPGVTVIGIDRDPQALALAGARLAPFGQRFIGVHAVYDDIAAVIAAQGLTHVQGILMDLGVSSLQLDETERGFAYSHDAPLDMRMNPTTGMTAADLLNTYTVDQLVFILRTYGEERFAPRIARSIVARRDQKPWERTAELADLVRACIPAATRKTGGHPAKRTFQALRIEVNGELDTLQRAVPAAIGALAVGGRIVVESYHSLEDRIVKQAMARGIESSAPDGLPIELDNHKPYLTSLTRGAEKADPDELAHNPRSASVRLRAAQRVRATSTTSANATSTFTPHRPARTQETRR